MLEYLQNLDTEVFSAINGIHAPFFDSFMWLATAKFAWIPIILALIYVIFKHNWRQALLITVGIAVTITLCDQISSSIIKQSVERLRPSHCEALASTIHIVNGYHGGLYGFVSSHAANSFGVAMLLTLIMKRWHFSPTIFLWAAVLSYSRIYLGVHYPGDILCGAILGMILGWLVFLLYRRISCMKWFKCTAGGTFSENEVRILSFAILLNLVLIMAVAPFYAI